MLMLSLAVNVGVLCAVCGSMGFRAPWVEQAYGPATQARGILFSVYLSILITSAALLVALAMPDPRLGLLGGGLLSESPETSARSWAQALLAVQIVYKLLSPFGVGTWKNPVVLSNLAIAALHTATLISMRR